jgi:hypothetical protein
MYFFGQSEVISLLVVGKLSAKIFAVFESFVDRFFHPGNCRKASRYAGSKRSTFEGRTSE